MLATSVDSEAGCRAPINVTFGGLAAVLSITFSALISPGPMEAATITAKSVSLADVSAAVAEAKNGDSVIVPAGTATWTAPLNITNNITLQGAGAASTIIIDEVPRGPNRQSPESGNVPRSPRQPHVRRTAPGVRGAKMARSQGRMPGLQGREGSFLISISLAENLPFRLTGFTFKGGNANMQKAFRARIQISGNSHTFRIDHCTFDHLHGLSINVSGFLWGVIDHCEFNTAGSATIHIGHDKWNGGTFGNGSWADEPYWGSEKFVFIEDNVFDNQSGVRGGIDWYRRRSLCCSLQQISQLHFIDAWNRGPGSWSQAGGVLQQYLHQ